MMIKLFKNYLFVYWFIVLRLMQSYIFFRNQTTFATILPQISLCLGGVSHRLHESAQKLLLSGASHRLHRSTQKLLILGGVHLSQVHQHSKQWFSHRFHRSAQMVRLRKIVAEAGYLRYYENLWENIRSKSGFGGRAYNYHEAVMPLPHTCNSVTS